MIKRIFITETDRNNLSKCKTEEEKTLKTTDFTDVVVVKPWGYEYLMYENEFVSIWILHLRKNCATSMHCHPRKKTSLILLSGKIIATTLNEWFELSPFDGLIYEEGVFHTTKALTDVILMEIETPPNKHDLVRLKDMYGREKKGYEGSDRFSRDLKRFKYTSFKISDINKKTNKLANALISIRRCDTNYLTSSIKYGTSVIYSLLENSVQQLEEDDNLVLGNIYYGSLIKDWRRYSRINGCLLLTIEKSQMV